MTHQTENLLAAAFELGLPLLLAIAAVLSPRARKWSVVVLGSLTPLLLFYAFNTVGYLQAEQGALLTWGGMWVASLVPYLASAVSGAALGFVRVPRTASARYVFGLLPPTLLFVAWALVSPQ